MLNLAALNQPLAARLGQELDEVVVIFERQLASELSAVNSLCLHIENYRGKMLRPTLVLLSAVAATDDMDVITAAHRTVAAVTEMIHMATLVHDDVLDEAEVRRRGATVNHLWGNEAAVMLGDYLISNAFHLCSTIGDPTINLALGEVTNTLCEGELAQLHHRNDYGLTAETYETIIRRKTASLIGACCALGARLAGAGPDITSALDRIGNSLGVAFQIQDDVLDLVGDETVVGKTLGQDLVKGKLTLPVILHLNTADQTERGRTLECIRSCDAVRLREALMDHGAVDAARDIARRFVSSAQEDLEVLPDGTARRLFHTLAESVVTRER